MAEEKSVLVADFEDKISALNLELDESNAVNSQLREESEQQDERISQLKEAVRAGQEETAMLLETKDEQFS